MKSAEDLLGSRMDKNGDSRTGRRRKKGEGREKKPRKGVTHELMG
jgi:hypothetical protein